MKVVATGSTRDNANPWASRNARVQRGMAKMPLQSGHDDTDAVL